MHTQTRATTAVQQYESERRHPRFLLSSPVSVRQPFRSGSRLTRGITLEISLGGLSAVLCGPPPVGERVSLRLKLQNSAIEAPAIVRHSSSSRTGFEFLNLPPQAQHRIESCIQRSLLHSWPKQPV
ncbi:MAG TPA: PilZ domain-containing protein [Terriglobales bacterium]|nr:PilZ domain-containing protein [Terriglobales bacterium]